MTPSQLEQAARERYNAVGETFWSQSEILTLIYGASLELATETKCIEETYTTTTVADTQEYDFPTNTISLKYVTYNGIPIDPIDLDQANSITLNTTTSNTTGSPLGYSVWGRTISFWPTPDDAKTVKLYTYDEPQVIVITSTLQVPSTFHIRMLNYINAHMAFKDSNFTMYDKLIALWEKDKLYVKQWVAKRKRGHRFAAVKDEESMPFSYSG